MGSIRAYIFRILNVDKENYLPSRIIDTIISGLIFSNVVVIILDSYPEIHKEYNYYFKLFEIFSVCIFTVEYFLRIWTSPLLYKRKYTFSSYIKFIFSGSGIIDLLAIIPFYLPLVFTMDLIFIRSLRLLRLLRILKLSRYSESLRGIGNIIREKRADLGVTFFLTFILLIIASTLMYNIEHQAQPENYKNIGDAFWWAIATLTTVGYGDIYPITNLGRFFSGVIAVLGIGLVALPTGIISSAFIQNLEKRKSNEDDPQSSDKTENKKFNYCPHCGDKLP